MNQKERKFVQTVRDYYQNNGRDSLPWRKTKDPYKILVSEVMLQQTQVDRVLPKYQTFITYFPKVEALAASSLKDVLRMWQGLGYNRRAKMLQECAKTIVRDYGGRFPRSVEKLVALSGVGPYTASAVCTFSFNLPTVMIETNIRSAYLYHFFKDEYEVRDSDLLPIIERTLDREMPRQWYYALMDYGSYLKKVHGNPNKKSKHHVRQSTFKGSDRQLRGALIRLLTKRSHKRIELHTALSSFEDIRIDAQLQKLAAEGMVTTMRGDFFSLPG